MERIDEARAALAERLRARRVEIEQEIQVRVYGISDPTKTADPAYAEGLRATLVAALDYGLAALESGEDRAPPPPPILLAQARAAARSGVDLDTVLRRYFAGYTLLMDFLMEEAEQENLHEGVLKRVLRAEAALFDHLVAVVSQEYRLGHEHRLSSSRQREVGRVKRLLAGELVDPGDLEYSLDGWHLAVVAAGPGGRGAIRGLARKLGQRLLLVEPNDGVIWGWLGFERRPAHGQPECALLRSLPAPGQLAVGEPGKGLAGWRLSHQQALRALPIAVRGPDPLIRYGDVALLTSALHDDVLATFLREVYLAPLARGRDGGGQVFRTLEAYFAADRNVSSCAAALGVSRQTVNNHLRSAEQRIGRPLGRRAAELQTALRLRQLDSVDPGTGSRVHIS